MPWSSLDKKINEMPDWTGHERATSAMLLDVLTTATSGSAKISLADRVLYTACEFWAAARNASLMEQLREDPKARLRAAEAAFTVIGLRRAASLLHHGRMALAEGDPALSLRHLAAFIETSLAALDEPVDRMIAAYAANQRLDRQNNPR
jgi:hypothetical protein